ncbi:MULTISPECIES: HAD-IIA family hydrolase [Trueperella]|uniref:HAD-IIA family hydrolase n=1 Tax=Trueperella bernardiae TaxID=59561 RepID=A0A0W1KJJ7_9ACTO|nr:MULTISPECIES: HAD-IIA family hydrolase [Trueperella]KTF03815.1 Ribonucleotide monophosphatase NagD [Trueperella bernardiae]MCM3907475.1 HAD-IIA family hydrolase [Trueperella bernardiae]MDK8602318.1 HAD-IIA family hydrolase [Trueperella bernardiae]MDV6239270.1 HAD-IIA family hydrolase [Trueperella bernardiae]OCW61188.1 HAD family hydrolase [Trueperella bernardiae]
MSAWLIDMDGVLVHEGIALDGAKEFLNRLEERDIPHLILTNNSIFTPRDLSARLATSGLQVPPERIWTSALATAKFLANQTDNRRAFVVGEAGLTTALYEEGFVMTSVDPEFVVLGETRTYSFEMITTAIRLIQRGVRFIATNPDPTGPSADGDLPATGAVAAMIEKATGRSAFFVGKPNPIMLRNGLNKIGAHSEETSIVGDRMDTDIQAGVETGLCTHLVLTGSTKREDIIKFPYRPNHVHASIKDVIDYI